jgi:hypothetical protein
MGVLATDAEAGQGCEEIQLTGNLVTARHRKLVRAQRCEALLRIDIEGSGFPDQAVHAGFLLFMVTRVYVMYFHDKPGTKNIFGQASMLKQSN